MITIITGTPGAGKTLYAVSKLVQKMVGTTIEHNGQTVERRVFTNINGLLLDHEKIDGGANGGLRNWQEWAQPGAIIVFDEVQKVWEPRPNGSKVPADIQALETHRHMGVDFVLITQGLSLTERNLSMLCNRHLHVRRVANMPFAVVYEWDHASRQLMYSRAVTTQKWFYDRKAYKLYKSAEVHTKQARSTPKAIFTILLGLGALGLLVPFVYGRLGERFGWNKGETTVEVKKAPTEPAKPVPGPVPAPGPAVAAANPPAGPAREVRFVGCAAMRDRCTCFDSAGAAVEKEPGFCKVATGRYDPPTISLAGLRIPEQEAHQRQMEVSQLDQSLFAFVATRQDRQSPKAQQQAQAAKAK